ncbi:sulfotransferase [Gramella lutea]|uniref:Sulfotransferase n=1 Tax=Christiangramia lutea TaxID=1607951 RepID=A0A9X2A7V9_9FLAO|nr:sulfotransferase [Christiangramia lutea]MCH4821590.1 sulfotransferase [Christiangramia lutea]
MNKVICITGMHRSGTSLTASWLQKCGVDIGEGNLMGESAGNKLGHFEDLDFFNLHSEIITRNDPNSKGWIVNKPLKLQFNEKDRAEAKLIIDKKDKWDEVWGWKDPRTVLFLKDWQKEIPDLKFLFVWRSSNEVVNSLLRRYSKSQNKTDKIGFIRSLKTWKIYNSRILAFYKNNPNHCLLVNIDDIINNDKSIFSKINEMLDGKLEYIPLEQVVEESLFSKNKNRIITSLISLFLGIPKLEKQLTLVNQNS